MTSDIYREMTKEELDSWDEFLDSVGFRLLMPGDKLQSDDEFFHLDSGTWKKISSATVNITIGTSFHICRRKKQEDWFDLWNEPTPVSVPKEPEEKPVSEGDRLYKFFFGRLP